MRRRPLLVALVLAAVASVPSVAPVSADPRTPPSPSAADVRRAREAAAVASTALTAADARRSAAEAALHALDSRLEVQVERWNAARGAAEVARTARDLAQVQAADARRAARAAQVVIDRLAAASYQVGADLSGGLGEWAAVVDSVFRSGGIQGLADRTTALGLVTADRRRDLEMARTLTLLALQQEALAQRAAADLSGKELAVAASAAQVRREQESQQFEVARLVVVRDTASATLASARTRADALTRQRAAAIARAAAEARARAEAAARARAEAERRARERERSRARQLPRDIGTPAGSWPEGSSTTTLEQRLAALAWARTQFGKPYVAGLAGPDGYDCSGLTSAAYRAVGKSMVQFSQAQFAAGAKIPVSQLGPGDLVFFATGPTDYGTIHHVGIYAGGGQMVEAPHTGDVVKLMTIWQDELVAYGARP